MMHKFKNKKFMSALLATATLVGGKSAPKTSAVGNITSSNTLLATATLVGGKSAPKTSAVGNITSSTTSNITIKSVEYYESARKKALIGLCVCVVLLPTSIFIANKVADYLEKMEESELKKTQEVENKKRREYIANLAGKLSARLIDRCLKKFDEERNRRRVMEFETKQKIKEKQAAEYEQKEYQNNYNKFVKQKFDEFFKNNQHKELHDLLSKVFQNEWDVVCKKVIFVHRPLVKWENGSYMDISYQNGAVTKCNVHAIPNPKEPEDQQLLKEMINSKAFEEKIYTELEGWGSYLSDLTHDLYNSFKFMFEKKWVNKELKSFEVKDNSIGYSLSSKKVTDKIEFLKNQKILRFTISNSELYNTNVDLTFDLDVSEYLS